MPGRRGSFYTHARPDYHSTTERTCPIGRVRRERGRLRACNYSGSQSLAIRQPSSDIECFGLPNAIRFPNG